MDCLDFDDIEGALARVSDTYQIHFLSMETLDYEDDEEFTDTCYGLNATEFAITLSWVKSHEQPFSNYELPRVALVDPKGVILAATQSFALTEDDYVALMDKLVADDAPQIPSNW